MDAQTLSDFAAKLREYAGGDDQVKYAGGDDQVKYAGAAAEDE